ncbi:YCII-related domain containing protein [Aureococcus anophagefferens]|nr:YCII-related domain containing protein [Aureococcus anophagefferens]
MSRSLLRTAAVLAFASGDRGVAPDVSKVIDPPLGRVCGNWEKCIDWIDERPELDPANAVTYRHLAEPQRANLSCCGPAVACPPRSRWPACSRVPFGEPPACVARRFACCLRHWAVERFALHEAYAGKTHVRCNGKTWDVAELRADDVLFDHRSLHKLCAAFNPHCLFVWEQTEYPPPDQRHASLANVSVVVKMGDPWFQVHNAPGDALVLANNPLANPLIRRGAPTLAVPSGVKRGPQLRDECAARRSSGRLDPADYFARLAEAAYAPSMPGVGWQNYRDTEAVVAGAVPILETPPLLPERGYFDALLDELPHVRVRSRAGQESEIPNFKGSYLGRAVLALPEPPETSSTRTGTSSASRTPDGPPAGDARKFYPFYSTSSTRLRAGVAADLAGEPGRVKVTAPGSVGKYPRLDPNAAGCRWFDPE